MSEQISIDPDVFLGRVLNHLQSKGLLSNVPDFQPGDDMSSFANELVDALLYGVEKTKFEPGDWVVRADDHAPGM
jgi:hypothetical protein